MIFVKKKKKNFSQYICHKKVKLSNIFKDFKKLQTCSSHNLSVQVIV